MFPSSSITRMTSLICTSLRSAANDTVDDSAILEEPLSKQGSAARFLELDEDNSTAPAIEPRPFWDFPVAKLDHLLALEDDAHAQFAAIDTQQPRADSFNLQDFTSPDEAAAAEASHHERGPPQQQTELRRDVGAPSFPHYATSPRAPPPWHPYPYPDAGSPASATAAAHARPDHESQGAAASPFVRPGAGAGSPRSRDENAILAAASRAVAVDRLQSKKPQPPNIRDELETVKKSILSSILGMLKGKIDSTLEKDIEFYVDIYESFPNNEVRHCNTRCVQDNDPAECCWTAKFGPLSKVQDPAEKHAKMIHAFQVDVVRACDQYLESNKKMWRKIPEFCKDIFDKWINEHLAKPYPDESDCEELVKDSGLRRKQILQYLKEARNKLANKGILTRNFRKNSAGENVGQPWFGAPYASVSTEDATGPGFPNEADHEAEANPIGSEEPVPFAGMEGFPGSDDPEGSNAIRVAQRSVSMSLESQEPERMAEDTAPQTASVPEIRKTKADYKALLDEAREEIVVKLLGRRSMESEAELDHLSHLYLMCTQYVTMHCYGLCKEEEPDHLGCCWNQKFGRISAIPDEKERDEALLTQFRADITKTTCDYMGDKKVRVNTYPNHCVQIIEEWIAKNVSRPFPSSSEVKQLVQSTGLRPSQVSYYMENFRAKRWDAEARNASIGPFTTQAGPRDVPTKFSPEATEILQQWGDAHTDSPFLKEQDINDLIAKTHLNRDQIIHWCQRFRARNREKMNPNKRPVKRLRRPAPDDYTYRPP